MEYLALVYLCSVRTMGGSVRLFHPKAMSLILMLNFLNCSFLSHMLDLHMTEVEVLAVWRTTFSVDVRFQVDLINRFVADGAS